MSINAIKKVPIIRLNQPTDREIVSMLIDAHNSIRCGNVDQGRQQIEKLLGDMVLNWKDVVRFPEQPSL